MLPRKNEMDLGNVVLTPWHFLQGSWAENPISDTLKKFFDVPSYEKVGRLRN